MHPRELFAKNLPMIETIVARKIQRERLMGADAEDFASSVRQRLVENDYAVLRRYAGRASLVTYVAVVVQRVLRDLREQDPGRWSPPADGH